MSDSVGLMAFVSNNGYVIGIGKAEPNTTQPEEGMVVAILQTQVTLTEWLGALNKSPDLIEAVKLMVGRYGGEPMARKIKMKDATFVPLITTQIAEA